MRLVAVVAAAALLAGADGSDRTLDLAAPQPFAIEGDVPVLPPPAPPPVVGPPSAQPGATPPLPARESVGAPPGSARALPGAPPGSALPAAPSPLPARALPGAPPGSATFTVQVGAFRSGEQARALAQRLAARGYDAYVMTVDLGVSGGQGIWHRVRVGRFPDRQPAADLATRLADTERVPAQVLREVAPAP